MSSISQTGSLSSQIEALVSQYAASLRTKQISPLENKRTSLGARLNVLSELKTRLQALYTTSDGLTQTNSTSKFKAYLASSSLESVVTATADSAASIGAHSLFVSQLAKYDTIVSARFTSAGTTIAQSELTAAEQAAGQGTRQFAVMENGVVKATVSVALNWTATPAGDTNGTVLSKIASAINGSSNAAAVVSASVVTVTPTESKLVLTSKSSGSTHTITLQDVGTGTLMQNIGLPSSVFAGRTAPSATTVADDPLNNPGGYLYTNANSLDAVFTLDGIELRRQSNTVSDALSGVTFNLKSVQQLTDSPATVNVAVDKDGIKGSVQSFLTDYNAAITYLNQKTAINPNTYVREILAGDSTALQLRLQLRQMVITPVTSVAAGNPYLLADVGISAAADGTLSITDVSKFSAAMNTDSTKMADLFNSSDGVAVRLKNYLDRITAAGGTLDTTRSGVTDQLNSLNDQITRATDRMNAQVAQFRAEFVQLQSLMTEVSAQQQQIASLVQITG